MGLEGRKGTSPVVNCLREATRRQHDRVEERFDAVAELADPSRRPATIRRYSTFYRSARNTLAGELESMEGLELARRRRAWRSTRLPPLSPETSFVFPEPADLCEALGLFYTVEGSTLGGRHILRELRARGIADATLSFLDPYGPDAGSMWRSLILVIEREGSRGSSQLDSMCRGATRGFAFAESVLCGDDR